MIKYIIGALASLALITGSYAQVSPFTGVGKNMDWNEFVHKMDTDAAAKNTFTAGLQLDVAGIVPATGVATFLATPTSANFFSAITNETGSGLVVGATSPTLTTPVLGVATATSINKVTITQPANGATLTIADGKTATVSDSGTVFTSGTLAVDIKAGIGATLTLGDTAATTGVLNFDNAATECWEAAPASTDVCMSVNSSEQFTFTNEILTPTLVTPVFKTGFSASGSAANTFAGSTGTFVTSTGLNTISGKMAQKVIATPVAAAATPAALGSANIVTISSDTASKGTKLLTGVAGDVIYVLNTSSTAAALYPATGGTINGGAANAQYAIPASKGSLAICTAADTWTVYDLTSLAVPAPTP